MLQRLVDVRPSITCDSLHAALTGVIQHLLVAGYPAAEIISKQDEDTGFDPLVVFERVRSILVEASFLDPDAPIDELASGVRRVRVPNPLQSSLHVKIRIRIDESAEPAAILLRAFLVLRARYQTIGETSPMIRLEVDHSNDATLDTLYLIGDAFTERYPVTAEIACKDAKVVLTLTGEPPLITGGLTWPRDDYIRSRDATLLIRPVREALDGCTRPLIIPREVRGPLGDVRVRVPQAGVERTKGLAWLSSLQELRRIPGGEVATLAGPLGEHLSLAPTSSGYVISTGDGGIQTISPVRCNAPTQPTEIIVPEAEDGSVAIAFEALGGAREIGANCYYYTFGHRGLMVDAGFDASRDGWLGLPALERVSRLDVIILTHAHLDHIGAFAVLLAAFPTVPIYCTRATLAVLIPQLRDSATVGKLRFEQTGEAPAFSRGLVERIRMEQFRLLEYGVRTELKEIPGLTVEFSDAGHIIGSAGARLEFGGISILHAGDISVEDQHLLRGMQIDQITADHVVMEGTYCGEPEFTREQRRAAAEQFLRGIGERIDAGGSVLVPAFSLGRAQELSGMLVDWNDRTGRAVPIWTVGLVNVINEISAAYLEFLPKVSGNPFARVRAFPMVRPNMKDHERRDEYARIFLELAGQSPCVVIASHGMMTENTGSYLIGRAILGGDDPRHGIFLCGYMDPRTPGFRLRHEREESVIDYGIDEPIVRKIPSENIQFHRLTAHASYQELIEVALAVPKKSVTFIHGDGLGLDRLKADLDGRLQSSGKLVTVRVPAIGERFLLEQVRPPPDWDDDTGETSDYPQSLGPGRLFDRPTGLSIRGLTEDRRWALIPVGLETATLALESNRIDPSRVERVDIRPYRGNLVSVFDRTRGLGDLSRIQWSQPGRALWMILAREPSGRLVRAEFRVSYGAEVRAVQTALDANYPVLEVEIGGNLLPSLIDVTNGWNGPRIPVETAWWDADSRRLRIELSGSSRIGGIDDLFANIRWPNGFVQNGPGLSGITLEPRIEFRPGPSRVGVTSSVEISSIPTPTRARIGGNLACLDERSINFVPIRPGDLPVELEYQTISGDREWRTIGSVLVRPGATVDGDDTVDVGRDLHLIVRDLAPNLLGQLIVLRVGSNICDQWKATGEPHSWSGTVVETGDLDVTVTATNGNLILWSSTVHARESFEFDPRASLRVTTIDGSLDAKLAWVGPDGWNRSPVEKALLSAGFVIMGWSGNQVRVRGTPRTLGMLDVLVDEGTTTFRPRILTLSDVQLRLEPPGPFDPGESASVCLSNGELRSGIDEIDGGPLTIEVDRTAPLFDTLSARKVGNRVHFLYPGRYSIAIVAGGERISEVIAEVRSPILPNISEAVERTQRTVHSADEASTYAAEFGQYRTTEIFASSKSAYEVLQDGPGRALEAAWQFVSGCLADDRRVLVTWPGLALSDVAGQLLRRLRENESSVRTGHLGYPAPRGEIASNERQARNLRRYRVLCAAPASSDIDRGDAYYCPQCSGRPRLKTDNTQIWLECPQCGYADHELVVTLSNLRSTDIQVLFADFRIAKYLTHGPGTRYAGAFGRSVRCSSCHSLQLAFSKPSPWDRAELNRLVAAFASVWDTADEAGSIRRAAWKTARQTPKSTPTDILRFESALHQLIESKIIVDGQVRGPLDRLEAGLSLCCGEPLMWSGRRLSHLFFDVEQLVVPEYLVSLHPGLSKGRLGIRQFLALAE